jgi:hypothetical protein
VVDDYDKVEGGELDEVREIDAGTPNPLIATAGSVIDMAVQNSPAAMLVKGSKAVLGLDHVKLDEPSTWTRQPPIEKMLDPAALELPDEVNPNQLWLDNAKGPTRDDSVWNLDDAIPTPKGKGGLSGTLSGTLGPGVPADLKNKNRLHQMQSAAYESLYHQARMDAAGIMGNIYDDLVKGYEDDVAPIMKEVDALLTEAEEEREGIRELIEKAKSNEINPGQFFANVGEAGKFSAAIAVGAGAMATAFGGGPNVAYQIISRAIDRNVRAQVVNQHHGRALIAHQTNFVNTIRGLSKDRAQYGNYVKLALDAIAMAEVGKVRASLTETGAKLASQDVWARLHAKLTGDDITTITNSQARVTFKYKNLVQLRKAAAILGVSQQMQKSTGAGKKTGKAPAAGGGGSRQGQGGSQLVDSAIAQGGSGGEIVDRYIKSMREQGIQPQKSDRDALESRLEMLAEQNPEQKAMYTAALNEARSRPNTDYKNLPTAPISYGDRTVNLKIRDQKRWDREGASQRVSTAMQNVADYIELDELAKSTNVPPNASWLKDFGITDRKMSVSTFFGETQAQRQSQMRALTTAIQKRYHASLEPGTRNAMNHRWEQELAAVGSGVGTSFLSWLGDMFTRDPDIRRARLSAPARKAKEAARRAITDNGLVLPPGL